MISKIFSFEKDYEKALKWLLKADGLEKNSYFDNMVEIEKANLFFLMGNRSDYKKIVNSLLSKDNLTNRQKQLSEELFSLHSG